jgi:hypothetical protein
MSRITTGLCIAVLFMPARATAADPPREGEEAVVVVKDAPVQKGIDVLTRIPVGTRVPVLRIRDGWIRVRYASGASTFEGWVDESHLAPAVLTDGAKSRKLPDHFVRLARVLLHNGLVVPGKEEKTEDPAKALAELKTALAELKTLVESDSREFRALAADGLAEMEWFAKLMRSTLEHPDLANLPRDSTIVYSVRNTGPVPQVDFSERTIAPSESLNTLRARVYHSYDELRALSLRVAAHIRRNGGGPVVERGRAVAVDFSEALPFEGKRFYDSTAIDPFDNPDRLRLVNTSGVTLTNCIVEVKLVGAKETRYNVHFVPKWPAGEARATRYYPGVESGSKQVFRTTAGAVERVEVSVCAEQLTQSGIEYRYDDREREHAFREYVNRATVTGSCERYVGVFTNGYRVRASFEGIPFVPNGRLTARVKRDGVWSEDSVAVEKWRSGRLESIDFSDLGEKNVLPTEYEIELEVRHGKHSWTRTFSLKP